MFSFEFLKMEAPSTSPHGVTTQKNNTSKSADVCKTEKNAFEYLCTIFFLLRSVILFISFVVISLLRSFYYFFFSLPLVSVGRSFSLVVLQFIVFRCVWYVKINNFTKDISCKTQGISLCRILSYKMNSQVCQSDGEHCLKFPTSHIIQTYLILVTVSLSI